MLSEHFPCLNSKEEKPKNFNDNEERNKISSVNFIWVLLKTYPSVDNNRYQIPNIPFLHHFLIDVCKNLVFQKVE